MGKDMPITLNEEELAEWHTPGKVGENRQYLVRSVGQFFAEAQGYTSFTVYCPHGYVLLRMGIAESTLH